MPKKIDYVLIEDDEEGLPEFKREMYREADDPFPEIVLEVVGYRHNALLPAHSLGGIDFYAAGNDWTRGRFTCVSDIPARCGYLRQVAKEMGLPMAHKPPVSRPADESPSYRAAMIDAGRGRLLR